MVKKLLFFITGGLVLMCLASQSQPVLTAANMNPVVGESFTMYTAAWTNPGTQGISQTWDLSSMSGTSTGLTNVVAPASTPNGSSFTAANVACYNATSGYAAYYNTTSTALEFYGTSASLVIPYTNPEDYLQFPLSYTNTFTDYWAAQYANGPYTYYRKGHTVVTSDGYGTLILPTGSYTNVMRVHFVQTYLDSLYAGSVYITNYTNDEYMWYQVGTHHQLAIVWTINSSSSGTTTGGSYSPGIPGYIETPTLINSCDLYPNPVSDNLILNFSLLEKQNVQIKLVNSIGQQFGTDQFADGVQGMNILKMDVATLPEGIYIMQIMLNGNIADNKRFVITR